MKDSKSLLRIAALVIVSGIVALPGNVMAQAVPLEERGVEAKWYFAPGLGIMDFEGDQSYSDGVVISALLGYDYSERWTFEGGVLLAPSLDANPDSGATWGSTYALGFVVDGLFHFTRWDRVDPYFAAGLGITTYGEKPVTGDQSDIVFRGGGGIIYHFNDEWAIRADGRVMLAGFGGNPNANSVLLAGVCWTWGAYVEPDFEAKGLLDSDRDGLTDVEEGRIGTDPYDPDTDKDDLTDGEEVNQYKTDPLNPDTDLDFLKDGAEVKKHMTDPNLRDTDEGGVADGHEVIEDGTNPRKGHGDDDLQLFELYILFDYDKAVIKPDYFGQIDIIGKVLTRNPASTARIEGHADRKTKSAPAYNLKLSEKRATAVLEYLAVHHKVEKSRMKAVGYGFDRPKVKHDLINGTPENRRVEVYIRKKTVEPVAVPPADAPAMKAEDK